MPQLIDVPGMGVVEFPDGMTDDAIAKAIKANMAPPAPPVNPQAEQRQEVGRVADKVVRGGVTALPGLMGDVGLAVTKQQNKEPVEKLAGMGIFGLPGIINKLFNGGGTEGDPSQATHFGDVTKAIQTAGGLLPPLPEPKTSAGKAVGNVGEAAVSTAMGGGAGTLGQKLALGAGAGSGGELAARLFGDNALTRFVGSLVGGGAVGAGQSMVSNSDKLVRQATEHLTDADWQKARQMEEILNSLGVPHAKSQLLGPRSTLDDVVATASANPSVRPGLITATEGAPKASERAVNDFAVRNLPTAGPLNRSEVLTDVQETAANRLRTIQDQSNQAFTKLMPPKGTTYDQGRVRTLYNSLRQLADDPRFGSTTNEGKAILRLADDLVESRQWDTSKVNPTVMLRAQQAAKEAGVPLDPSQIPGARQVTTFVTNAHKINNLNKDLKLIAQSDDYRGLPINDVRRILNQATPEFNRARDAKSAVMQGQYNPASRGLTGQIAQMGGGPDDAKLTATDRAIRLVFDPTKPQGQAIKDLAGQIGGEQVGELLREHINKTMQQVLATADQNPQRFYQSLYQTTAQKENIDAALEVTARQYNMNPNTVKAGFQRLMSALDTFKDLKIAPGVSPGETTAQAGQNIVSQAATPLTGTRRFFERRVTTKTYQEISDLVTSKDGLAKLQAIAKAPNQEVVRQILIGTGVSTMQAPKE